jgi:hypothetical protein
MSKKIILFFIAGMVPTEAELAAAEKIGCTRFRNAKLAADPTDSIEKCDEVAGLVPERYKGVKGIKEPEAPSAPATAPKAPTVPKAPASPVPPATAK